MRASSYSSYSNSVSVTSLANRVRTIFKKAYELSILCDIDVCVILYGPSGKLKTWPGDRQKVNDIALRYKAAIKRKKNLNLHELLEEKKKNQKEKDPKKKKKDLNNGIKYPDWYPIFDHYSPHQLSQVVMSLEQTLSTLQEKLRFVEAQKQRNTYLVHQSLTPSSSLNQQYHHQFQTQPLIPSQFSPYMYDQRINHLMMQQQNLYGLDHNITNTNFQYPCVSNTLSAPSSSQLSNNQIQQQQLYGLGPNITNTSVQYPCVSNTLSASSSNQLSNNQSHQLMHHQHYDLDENVTNTKFQHLSFTQDYPLLLRTQESAVNNNGLMQHSMMQNQEPSGFDHNMCITNNNNNVLEHSRLSNTVSDDFQKNPDGDQYFHGFVFKK